MADDRITGQVVEYFTDLKYEDLPEDVVHTAKRIFMDIVGCGLGSHPLDKGATAVKLVKAKGGAPEATILGTGENVSPEELERRLNACPEVQECVVKEMGKKIGALICCAEEKQAEVRACITGLNRTLPLYQRITAVEFSTEPLPRNAMGKLLRR